MKSGLYPLQDRVMVLFDTLKEEHHVCGMDNLHNSTTFYKKAINRAIKVLVYEMTRKGMRGISVCVIQAEAKMI